MDNVREHPSLRPWLAFLTARHAVLGGLTEVRVLGGPRGVWSAFVGPDDVDALAASLQPGAPGGHPKIGQAGVYFGLNPIVREAVSGDARFQRIRSTTRDRDIRAVSLFVVDIDPVRSPRDRSASEAEKASALSVTERVGEWLTSQGARPLRADSGNGYHLLVPLVPAFDEDIAHTVNSARTLLRWLDAKFSTPQAQVDTSMFNPSRICKLYGTLAVKGSHSQEHPHRWSSIDLSDIPEDVDLFERLGAVLQESVPARTHFPVMERGRKSPWDAWRGQVLAALPLEAVYGRWLTGAARPGWLECRDPDSDTGDQNPSAGVADGTGSAERGSFHSFRTGHTESVFDFLMRRGHAADFRAAAALVAELAGQPTPDGQRDSFAKLRLCSEEERGRTVREAVRMALELPVEEQRARLDALRRVARLDARSMRAIVKEVRSEPPNTEAKGKSPRGLPVVDHIVNRNTVDEFFVAILATVASFNRFFRTEREMVFIRRGVGPIVVTPQTLPGLLSALIEIRQLRETSDGLEFIKYTFLSKEAAGAFVASPRVHCSLPVLNLYTRSPLFDERWSFIGQAGYHAASGVYYDGPAVEPIEGCTRLCEALSDFHFKEEADRVNFVGALLTALTMPHWGRGHPFLAVNGNKPGVGKSTLARVLGVLVEGSEPNTVSYADDEAEFEKQLATRIEAGDHIVIIDNAKTTKPIDSPVLERCITDTRFNFRRLGSNTAISRPQNDVLFCLTMNLVQLGADLRRRALPLNLELDANVRQTTYRLGDLVGWVAGHRLEILGELASMVLSWVSLGKPGCEQPARHSTNQLWAQSIDAILRLAGFDGFLTNFEKSEHTFDPRFEQMLEIAREHHGRPLSTAAGWVSHVESILEDRFVNGRGQPRTAKAKATIVGSMFKDYLGTRFELEGGVVVELVRQHPEGPHRSPAYGFAKVTP